MAIGYVGLGAMGRALAGRLIGAHDLVVWDLNPEAMADFVERGAHAAVSLDDLGSQCDLVILCLPKSANVEQALFGEAGLAAAMAPGTIIVDQTSGEPGKTREFSARLAQQGIDLIDAPVAGGVPSAVAGNITIMASGARDVFDRALPVLQSITGHVFCCSNNVGDGQAVKAINNLMNSACRIATLEIVAVGRWLGLETAAMTEALNTGAGRSFITSRLLPAIVEQRSSTDFSLALMVKDLNQAADLGFAQGAPMPISEAARGLINTSLNILGEEARLDDVVGFMERVMKAKFTGMRPAGAPHMPAGESEALRLIGSVVAACNRLIAIENTALAKITGVDLGSFAQVILSGSAASVEAEAFFASLEGQSAPDRRTLGSLTDDLSRLAQFGARCAVPMLMTNEVRAQCLLYVNQFGRDASIDAIRP